MHGRAARPGALLGDKDAQDEVLAKVVAADGLRRGAEGAAARHLIAPGPPLCSIFSTAGPLKCGDQRLLVPMLWVTTGVPAQSFS